MAGAKSIFYGEKLLTTGNPDTEHDLRLFRRLKIVAEPHGAAVAAQGAAAAAQGVMAGTHGEEASVAS